MGIFDALSGAPAAALGTENPYAAQRGLLGIFDNNQASRMLMASSILQAVANNAQHNQAPNMMALNEQEMKRGELERQYNSAMRYADKLEKSNPELAGQIRADWTLANYAQKKKLDYELDPRQQAAAALDQAKVQEIQDKQKMLDQFGFGSGQPATVSPGQSSQAQVPPAVQQGTSPPTVAVGGTAPVMTPEGVATATPLAIGSNMPAAPTPAPPPPEPAPTRTLPEGVTPEMANSNRYIQASQLTGISDLTANEYQAIRSDIAAGALSNEANPMKNVTAIRKQILDRRSSGEEDARKRTAFDAKRATIPEMQKFLQENEYYGINTLGEDPDALRAAVTEVVNRENDPAAQGAGKIADILAPGDMATKEVFKYNPEIARKLYQDQMAAADDPIKQIKLDWFGDKVERSFEEGKPVSGKLVGWKPTPENIRELELKSGVTNLSRRNAMRMKNSADPAATADKIIAEQTSTSESKEKVAMHLRDQYKKDVEGARKAMDAGIRVKSMMEDGEKGIRENPARALAIIYDYVKGLDADSAVKEGEVQMSKDIATMREEIERWYTSLGLKPGDKGAAVPVNVAIDLAQTTAKLADLAQDSMLRITQEYKNYAIDYGVANPALVVGRDQERVDYNLENNINPRAVTPNAATLKEAETAARAKAAIDPADPISNSGYD